MGLAKMYKNRDQGIRIAEIFFYRIDRIMQDRQDKKDV